MAKCSWCGRYFDGYESYCSEKCRNEAAAAAREEQRVRDEAAAAREEQRVRDATVAAQESIRRANLTPEERAAEDKAIADAAKAQARANRAWNRACNRRNFFSKLGKFIKKLFFVALYVLPSLQYLIMLKLTDVISDINEWLVLGVAVVVSFLLHSFYQKNGRRKKFIRLIIFAYLVVGYLVYFDIIPFACETRWLF